MAEESRVMHTMQRWLPLSEQFVHTLVTRSRHPGVVVSRFALEHTDTFPQRPVYSLARLVPRRYEWTGFENKAVTASMMAIALRHRARLVHHHHGYRVRDSEGVCRRLKLPRVLSLHGQDVTTQARLEPDYYAGAFSSADAVIVPSRFLAGPTEELGVDPSRIRVIPSGVDTAFFAPTPVPAEPRAVFVGRFVEKKGIDVLLEAWPKVRAEIPEAVLTLVGFGELEPLARAGGAGVAVEPARATDRAAQVRDAIRRARVVVTPSRTAADGDAETLLLVNLEAQASGRPLVTTRHGGIPEYVDEDGTALVVPEADAEALAGALVRALAEPGLAERLGGAGPAWASPFDVAACVAQVDDLYDELIGRR